MVPDNIILWVASGDEGRLPSEIRDLSPLIDVRTCEDTGPYKKIIPALETFPDHVIITADDDAYYWPSWLEELVQSWSGRRTEVVGHLLHRIQLNNDRLPAPYSNWSLDDPGATAPSRLNFPAGVGGVLYPPGVFHSAVCNSSLFMDICPMADDVWLYWMARLNQASARRTKSQRSFVTWLESQGKALWKDNVSHGNDNVIKAMVAHFGFPN